MNNYLYIKDSEQLKNIAEILGKEKELGIDLECENNLHYYGTYITLIQISTKTQNYIIDVLELGSIDPIIRLIEDEKIIKIFHNLDFDIRILRYQFNCDAKNLFDTQLAATFLNKQAVGLGALLDEYFSVIKEKKFQMADWTKRPIRPRMLEYAIIDSKYLIQLKKILSDELKELGRLKWVNEELIHIEEQKYIYRLPNFLELKGIRKLDDSQRAVLKKVYDLREILAKKVDRPVFFIMNTKTMTEIAMNRPKKIDDILRLRSVHPVVKKNAAKFLKQIEMAKNQTIQMPPLERKKYSTKQRQKVNDLTDKRDAIAEELGIAKYLILNKEDIQNIVLNDNFDLVLPWKKELILG